MLWWAGCFFVFLLLVSMLSVELNGGHLRFVVHEGQGRAERWPLWPRLHWLGFMFLPVAAGGFAHSTP